MVQAGRADRDQRGADQDHPLRTPGGPDAHRQQRAGDPAGLQRREQPARRPSAGAQVLAEQRQGDREQPLRREGEGGGTVTPRRTGVRARCVEPARAREPVFVAVLWVTGALKAIAGLLALALIRPWGRVLPRWIPLTATWVAGVGMLLYGGANLAVRGIMAAGLLATPAAMHSAAGRWHLVLWDPWWFLGGVLFVVAAWSSGRGRLRRRDA